MASGTGGVWSICGTSGRCFSEVVSLYLQPGKEPEAGGMAYRVKSFKMMLRACKWVEFSGKGGAQKEKRSDTTQQGPGSTHVSYLIPKSYLADKQPLGKIRNREIGG